MIDQISENELKLLIQQLNMDEPVVRSKSEEMKHANLSLLDGSIHVVEQKIIVNDPAEGGKFPVISALYPVKLKVNDTPVETEWMVTSKDRISWEVDKKPLFEMKISEDQLSAYFILHSGRRCAWRLVHTEPMPRLIITAEEDPSIILDSVHLSRVAAVLEERKIKSNLDLPAIQRELVQPTGKPVLVARGKAAVLGKDAQLEVYFSEHVESQFFEIGGSIDYRNHLQIPSVKSGELIAKKIPTLDGVPGYDVYGNVLVPATPKDVLVVAKPSVELTPDGEIIAKKEGRPRITGIRIKTFDISTSFVVSGNVDIETGNIVFSGDVIVYGNVTDGMIVESLGNVYVYGSVFSATITATGSIHVRGNVLGSRLYSGYFGVMFNRLYNSSKSLSEYIEKLLAAAKMLEQALESRNQSIRIGQIVLLLLEEKLKDIPAIIKELLTVISNIQNIKMDEYQKLRDMSEMFLKPAKLLEEITYNTLHSYLALLQETHQEVARMQEDKAKIIINQCHNSELKSNGDIVIKREGVLLSQLYSARNIVFQHEGAVCRGAELEADGSIFAQIVGGQTGGSSVLKAKKKVSVMKMHVGRICIGRYCKDIFELVENLVLDNVTMRQRS